MNFLLDTNVVSELMRPVADDHVHQWVIRQTISDLFIPATTLAELQYGIRRLPDGRRRRDLQVQFDSLLFQQFADRILSFNAAAALCCGQLRALADLRGRPAGLADAEIAAIAITHSMTVATRDVGDFAGFGVPLVNPFDLKADR